MNFFIQAKTGTSWKFLFFVLVFVSLFSAETFSQKKEKVSPKTSATPLNLPKVTQVDEIKLKSLIKPNGKPLLVNFWATWCDPCREEFPDLVKISVDFKDKIDFITISLDDLAEINGDVPKFLAEMKAEMPAYLLKSQNEDAAITSVSKDWRGGMPFTILFNEKGEIAYSKEGKFKTEILRSAIEKLLPGAAVSEIKIVDLPINHLPRSTKEGKADAEKDIADGFLKIKRYGLTPAISSETLQQLKKEYNIEIVENGCVLVNVTPDYFKAYNETMRSEIQKRFSAEVLAKLPQ